MEEALRELGIPEDASSREKFEAVMEWELGDPSWAGQIIEWMVEAGYTVMIDDPDNFEGEI